MECFASGIRRRGFIRREKHDTILDVGCAGGRNVRKLAAIATDGKVQVIDDSEERKLR
jgi:2-polyprenyl-3-methyl-5-hydroxy-6-metoxy-1,4-benzoquinol methylase